MQFQATLRFLGVQERESKKSGNAYYLAKLMHEPTAEIYEMYIPTSKVNLVTNIGKAQMFQPLNCVFNVSAFNGKMQTDLHQISAVGEQPKTATKPKESSIKSNI